MLALTVKRLGQRETEIISIPSDSLFHHVYSQYGYVLFWADLCLPAAVSVQWFLSLSGVSPNPVFEAYVTPTYPSPSCEIHVQGGKLMMYVFEQGDVLLYDGEGLLRYNAGSIDLASFPPDRKIQSLFVRAVMPSGTMHLRTAWPETSLALVGPFESNDEECPSEDLWSGVVALVTRHAHIGRLAATDLGSAYAVRRLMPALPYCSLTDLFLPSCGLSSKDAVEFSRYLAKNKCLRKLCLAGNPLDSMGVAAIAGALTRHPTIREVDVSCVMMEGMTWTAGDALQAVGGLISASPSLRLLNLRSNLLQSSDVELLSQHLATRITLVEIVVSDNQLGDAGVAMLCAALPSSVQYITAHRCHVANHQALSARFGNLNV